MKQSRRKFDRNFKLKAVELSYQRSNIVKLAQDMGIRAALLYHWRSEFGALKEASFLGNGKVGHRDEEVK